VIAQYASINGHSENAHRGELSCRSRKAVLIIRISKMGRPMLHALYIGQRYKQILENRPSHSRFARPHCEEAWKDLVTLEDGECLLDHTTGDVMEATITHHVPHGHH